MGEGSELRQAFSLRVLDDMALVLCLAVTLKQALRWSWAEPTFLAMDLTGTDSRQKAAVFYRLFLPKWVVLRNTDWELAKTRLY